MSEREYNYFLKVSELHSVRSAAISRIKVEVLPKPSQGNRIGKLLGLGAPKPSLSSGCFRGTSIAPSEVRARRAHGAFPTQSK